jgi:hypothetical protein
VTICLFACAVNSCEIKAAEMEEVGVVVCLELVHILKLAREIGTATYTELFSFFLSTPLFRSYI